MPAIQVGLDLDERVVRRHVSKLEAAGWLGREPWVWGEGSVVWLTSAGMQATGLGGLRPVKAPPKTTTIAHGVLAGWSAARVEHRGRVWKSGRELATDADRWAVRARCERGYTELLPDLAVWLERSEPPVAVIAESGGRREDRQKMILEGWHDAILSGRYSAVHYHCANEAVEHCMRRLARKVGLHGRGFAADVQITAAEIAALPRATNAGEPRADATPHHEPCQTAPVRAPDPGPPVPIRPADPPTKPEPETPQRAAERDHLIREVLGHDEPERRRRWRR
jgi:hypothetical protein